ncbi:MAG: tRNA dihydrouridine synthase DusB [Lachnospiraceae bacterium]|nr:tRNA dihydrouridine synthase DusB [Lachnospiraceae bacterium]
MKRELPSIGGVRLSNPFILGPMAGVTDLPFRLICHEFGAGLVSMEMVSANAVFHGSRKIDAFVAISENEHPVSMQLFGPDPEVMAYAAGKLSGVPCDILDINMGCPVPKIVNNNEGSALMKDIDRAAAIVRAVKKAAGKPVTVKIRAGFSSDSINAPELAAALEEAGADAIAVHGRTRDQYYAGKADWSVIRRVKERVRIPVIGNGDADSAGRALELMEETGCDFVMIARAARGNPWIFRECLSLYEDGELPPRPSREETAELMLRHARMQLSVRGDRLGILEMRKHIAWYTQGYENSARVRAEINEALSYGELAGIIDRWARGGAV